MGSRGKAEVQERDILNMLIRMSIGYNTNDLINFISNAFGSTVFKAAKTVFLSPHFSQSPVCPPGVSLENLFFWSGHTSSVWNSMKPVYFQSLTEPILFSFCCNFQPLTLNTQSLCCLTVFIPVHVTAGQNNTRQRGKKLIVCSERG